MIIGRRAFLTSVAAVAVLPALPRIAMASPVAAAEALKPVTTIWVGGHDGEFDWKPFNAATKEDAIRQLADYYGWERGLNGEPYVPTGLSIERAPKMDGLQPDEIKPHHWIISGLGAFCDRCYSECYGNDTGRVFGTEVVCEDCTTISDLVKGDKWDIDLAEERLTEMFMDNDCDEGAVFGMIARDGDPNAIGQSMWVKCLAEARAEL